MNAYRYSQVLRSQLLDLFRLSQRTIDCCMKGYLTGKIEFLALTRSSGGRWHELHQTITELASDLKTTALLDDAELRFVQSSEAICAALAATYNHSLEIAWETSILLESGLAGESMSLVSRCEEVNGWVRLCTVAIFEGEIEHANAVLRSQGSTWLSRPASPRASHPRTGGNQSICAHELAIGRALDNIAEQFRLIAEAIVFWLDYGNDNLSCQPRYGYLLTATN